MRILMSILVMGFLLLGTANSFAEEPVWTKGKVTKIKPDQGKVTIRHEEIKNLDMPAMKMVFRVEDPALLESLTVGEEREFHFVKEKGRFMVKKVKE